MSQLTSLHKALFALRGRITVIAKDADNPFFKSKYADFPSIMEVLQPLFNEYGLLWMQPVLPAEQPGYIVIRNLVVHVESGESMYFDSLIPTGNASTPQAFGSAVTYGRRYTISAFLNLVTDEDDDGNAASHPAKGKQEAPKTQGKLSETQQKKLFAVAKECNWSNEDIHALIGKKGLHSIKDMDEDLLLKVITYMEKNKK